MVSNHKIKVFVFLFLVFCVLSSKNIIIYNEETLVALSFLAFVLFCFHFFGNTIKESLNERSESIKFELQNFLNLKQNALIQLKEEHHKISYLKQTLPVLGNFTEKQLTLASSAGAQSLNIVFYTQIIQKLSALISSRNTLQQRLQQLIAKNIQSLVLIRMERFKKERKGAVKPQQLDLQMIQNSIELLKKSHNKNR